MLKCSEIGKRETKGQNCSWQMTRLLWFVDVPLLMYPLVWSLKWTSARFWKVLIPARWGALNASDCPIGTVDINPISSGGLCTHMYPLYTRDLWLLWRHQDSCPIPRSLKILPFFRGLELQDDPAAQQNSAWVPNFYFCSRLSCLLFLKINQT